ncbi:MAG: GNAT family N-acetyltransferase [Myxococcota bacterium]
MALEIAPLTPAHLGDYLALFERAFSDNRYWSGCFCAFYDDPCPDAAWSPGPEAGAAHRAARSEQVRSGRAHGVLAFDGGRAVGWCNAGPRAAFGNLRAFGAAVGDPNERVGSVMCFVIAPERRREGIATALLTGAERLFRALGLAVAEAYPRAAPSPNPALPASASYYKGAPEMYERAGYALHRRFEHFLCVRKSL